MGVFINGYVSSGGVPWPRVTRTVVTASTLLPLSLAAAKAHCRIDSRDEDGNVLDWIRAATRRVETDAGVALLTQTLDLTMDGFPAGAEIELPIVPVQSVTSVTYTTTAGVATVWASSNYYVHGTRLALTDTTAWPTDTRGFAPLVVRVVAGYTSQVLIPSDLLHAVRLLVGWAAMNREPNKFEQQVYESWIAGYRRVLVA